MSTLFLDTEFNGFGGDLISLALVPLDEDIAPFYESLGCGEPVAWVYENVMPYVNKDPISRMEFVSKLGAYLNQFNANQITIVADWPDDISYFCQSLIIGPGYAINTPNLEMLVYHQLSSEHSETPHNALEDAKAIRKMFIEMLDSKFQ